MNVFQNWISSDVLNSLGPVLLDISVKATVVLLVAGAFAATLSRAAAAVRHRIWCLACCGLLILPVLTLTLPSLRIPILPRADQAETKSQIVETATKIEPVRKIRPIASAAGSMPLTRRLEANIDQTNQPIAVPTRRTNHVTESAPPIVEPTKEPAAPQPPESIPWPRIIAIAWLIGTIITALPLLYGFIANHRLRRSSSPAKNAANLELLHRLRDRLGLRRSISLLETGRAIIPMTWGLMRPIVLFPATWQDWSDSRRRLVLLHELAHVQRHDVAFQVLARLACSLYWFHPLAWYALRRVRIERELACDDCVLTTGERPSEYAGQLLEIARTYQSIPVPTAVAAVQPTSLEQRIRALLDKARSHVPLGRTTARILLLSALGLTVGVAVVKPGRATDEAVADQKKSDKSDTNPKRKRGTNDSDAAKTITVQGQVLGPDGKPNRQATVWLQLPFTTEWKRIASTDKAGRFSASIDRAPLNAALVKHPQGKVRVAATAEGYGLAWADVEPAELEGVTLKLRKDMPIEGRIVTLEGKPIVGVTVHVNGIPNKELRDLEGFVRAMPGSSGTHTNTPWRVLPGGGPGSEPVVTDKQGRFRIEGVGAERVVWLEAAGGGIGDTRLAIVTFPAPASAPSNGAIAIKEGLAASYYYARFTHVAVPGRTLQGVVTEEKTRDPVAGVRITALRSWHSRENPATTGADGRYTITGVPKQEKYHLLFEPQASRHFNKELRLPDSGGLDSLTIDVALRTGIILRGRLTDAKTGEPLDGTVDYNPLYPNENALQLGENHSIAKPAATAPVGEDGNYEISVLPGPGAIAAKVSGKGYVSATVAADRVYEVIGDGDFARPVKNADGEIRTLSTVAGPQSASGMGLRFYQAAAIINPSEDVNELTVDLAAVRGLSRPGIIKDDEGQPLVGVEVLGLGVNALSLTREPLETADFTIKGLRPGRTRMLLFVHEQRELGAKILVTGDKTTPLTVRLKPTGTITGRFVDKAGDPVPGIQVRLSPHYAEGGGVIGTRLGSWWDETNNDGRFRINGLIAGVAYRVEAQPIQEPGVAPYVPADTRLEPGETLDLGVYTRKNEYSYRRIGETSGEAETKADGAATSSQAKPAKDESNQRSSLRGRVVGPDGEPIAGARIYVREGLSDKWRKQASTDKSGRFTFPHDSMQTDDNDLIGVFATAKGYGFDVEGISEKEVRQPTTMHLVRDIPIRGRILNAEGQPVAGASIGIHSVGIPEDGNLDRLVEAIPRGEQGMFLTMLPVMSGPLPGMASEFVTDAEGRFEITGIGAERRCALDISGPGIAKARIAVLTREMEAITAGKSRYVLPPVTYGAAFDYVGSPGRTVRGTARDAKTGEPLAGVTVKVRMNEPPFRAEQRTDEQGRFEFTGCAKTSEGYTLLVTPRRLPYCSVFVEVGDTAGLDPIETTFNLVPGVLVAGRVVEKESGRPVRGTVIYNPLRSNTNLEMLGHRPGDPCSTALIKPDGTFEIAVLPGPGVLGVKASGNENDEKYMSALITKDEMLDKLGEAVTSACYRADDHLRIARDKNTYSVIRQERYQALALLDPEPEAHPLSVDLTCEVGRTIKGTIVGPDGEPIVGATAGGIDNTASRTAARTLETSTFTIEGLNPRRTRSLFFYHAEKGLGTAFEITGDHQGPLTVHLKPFGSVAGRWIDQNGEPFADQTVIAKYGPIRRMGVTDAKGNFQLDGLVPGMNYWMLVPGRSPFIQFEFKVKPGETTDVGTKTIVVQ